MFAGGAGAGGVGTGAGAEVGCGEATGNGVEVTTGTLTGGLGGLTGVAVAVGVTGPLVGSGAGAVVRGGGVGIGREMSGGSDASGGRFEGKLLRSEAGMPPTRGSRIGLRSGILEGTGTGRLSRAGSRASSPWPCRARSLLTRRVPACIRLECEQMKPKEGTVEVNEEAGETNVGGPSRGRRRGRLAGGGR